MSSTSARYTEGAFVKTKIIATIGPASADPKRIRRLIESGVDIFRLNFAHGSHEWLTGVVTDIRAVAQELGRVVGILGDLSGPKIRLGELPEEGFCCLAGGVFEFVRSSAEAGPQQLTCTYEQLIDDLRVDDHVLLADGVVSMRVIEQDAAGGRVRCVVEQPGCIRGKQGVNLPGVVLSTPSLTVKDHQDLEWALKSEIDFVGLSFVRSAEDVRLLKKVIEEHKPAHPPCVVAKIEKMEAVSDLEAILEVADAVMVARGDLGVEVDIERVPGLQKRIIRLCNQHRIPVITATQMLESMTESERPTRAEATDVANAVLDGSDAVMLSGETAIGKYPEAAVGTMSRLAREAERLLEHTPNRDTESASRSRASVTTEALSLAAGMAAGHLKADLIALATRTGRSALSLSKQRGQVPVVALTDDPAVARQMCLFWGVTPVVTDAVGQSPEALLKFVIDWGKKNGLLTSGSRVLLIGTTNWESSTKNLLFLETVP